jgi:hypothetical protein
MKKLALFVLLLTLSNPCHAALSGINQGKREIKEILTNPYLDEHLPQGHPINEIKLVEDEGTYRIYSVTAGDTTLLAKLSYVKTARCGPRCYEMEWETVAQ